MKVHGEEITFAKLNKWASTGPARLLKAQGWIQVPVVTFGGIRYAILSHDIPHEGHNTADVINITEYDKSKNFKIVVTQPHKKKHTEGYAWVLYDVCDGGMSILAIYTETGEITEYHNPRTAVLSYRIVPPTPEDNRQVADQLDDELQQHGVGVGFNYK